MSTIISGQLPHEPKIHSVNNYHRVSAFNTGWFWNEIKIQ